MTGGTTTGIAEDLSDVAGIKFGDSPSVDAFHRFRVGNPFSVFDNKNIFNTNPESWNEDTVGVGASIAHLPNESSIALTVGTVSGESAIRQTRRYFPYAPAKSQLITQTGVLGASKENVTKRIGYFDDDNGLFFEEDGTNLKVVIRTSTSGSPSDSSVNQADWNLDKMDGNGISGIVLDITKSQIFIIDFQWLGTGRVRFGFDIADQIRYVHEVNHANILDKVYMTTPSLPVRYEIRNTGIAASATTLKETCCAVISEGGAALPGFEFSVSNGINSRAITGRTPILAVRLLNSFNGKDNRKTLKVVLTDLFADTNNTFFEMAHLNDPSAITATWTPVTTLSAAEFSTDISIVTGNDEHVIKSTYAPVLTGNRASNQPIDLDVINLHALISQNRASNNSQIFAIFATSFMGTADVSSSISWVELD